MSRHNQANWAPLFGFGAFSVTQRNVSPESMRYNASPKIKQQA